MYFIFASEHLLDQTFYTNGSDCHDNEKRAISFVHSLSTSRSICPSRSPPSQSPLACFASYQTDKHNFSLFLSLFLALETSRNDHISVSFHSTLSYFPYVHFTFSQINKILFIYYMRITHLHLHRWSVYFQFIQKNSELHCCFMTFTFAFMVLEAIEL